jgi:flagellar hook-associated protein 3 FlgL
VFAGDSDTGKAFDATYAFSGTAGGSVQRRISATETATVDADGAAAFGTGSSSVFASLDAVATALRNGDQAGVQAGITAIQSHLTAISTQHAVVGARYARLEQAKQENTTIATNLEAQRSGIEDADATKVLIDLKSQEVAYQTAMAVTARVIQPTLMSYLS